VVGLTENDKKRKVNSLTRTCGLEFIPFYKPLLAHNGWRYVQLESAAFGPSVARVFARDLSYCRSIICINLHNLGIRNTEYVLKN
jgi:hypothetical protein